MRIEKILAEREKQLKEKDEEIRRLKGLETSDETEEEEEDDTEKVNLKKKTTTNLKKKKK